MRVEVIENIPRQSPAAGGASNDAATNLAIKNFIAAVQSDDSLLELLEPLTVPQAEVAEGGGFYIGEMRLEFRDPEQAKQKSVHFLLVEKLIELLKEAGSAQSLTATLCLTSKYESSAGDKGFALWIRLAARGESPEQAALRWSLGLTHIQQALLFTSRHLRMQIAQKN